MGCAYNYKEIEVIKPYQMTDLDRELLTKVYKAVTYANQGDPVRDVLDDYNIIEAMSLLLAIVDSGHAK